MPKDSNDFQEPVDPVADDTPPLVEVNESLPVIRDGMTLAPGIAPGDVTPAFNVGALRKALAANDVTAQTIIDRLCFFIDHPNPTYALAAMRLLLSHIETVIRLNGLTVKAVREVREQAPTSSKEPTDVDQESQGEDEEPVPQRPLGDRLNLPAGALHRLEGVTLRVATDPSFQ